MLSSPPSSIAARSRVTDEHLKAQLQRAADAADEHEAEFALRLLIEVVQALLERAPEASREAQA